MTTKELATYFCETLNPEMREDLLELPNVLFEELDHVVL
jgi:hypothetical protein